MNNKSFVSVCRVKNPTHRFFVGIIFPLLTIALLLFIWGHSAMDATLSTQESDFVLRILNVIFAGNSIITDYVVRKAAHFTEYFALGGLMSADVYLLFRSFAKYMYIPPFGGLLTACIDETIQIYSDGRSSSLMDVWLDFSGVLFGILFFSVIYSLILKRKQGL